MKNLEDFMERENKRMAAEKEAEKERRRQQAENVKSYMISYNPPK